MCSLLIGNQELYTEALDKDVTSLSGTEWLNEKERWRQQTGLWKGVQCPQEEGRLSCRTGGRTYLLPLSDVLSGHPRDRLGVGDWSSQKAECSSLSESIREPTGLSRASLPS